MTLSVRIVSADLRHLGDELDRLAAAGIRTQPMDAMDGVFCPQMAVAPRSSRRFGRTSRSMGT